MRGSRILLYALLRPPSQEIRITTDGGAVYSGDNNGDRIYNIFIAFVANPSPESILFNFIFTKDALKWETRDTL